MSEFCFLLREGGGDAGRNWVRYELLINCYCLASFWTWTWSDLGNQW